MDCYVQGVDHVRFFVGNALQSASFYCQKFGFRQSAFRGLQTGDRTRCTHVVTQGNCTFAFTSSLCRKDKDFHDEIIRHGDSVKDIAFTVSDVDKAFSSAIQGGASCIVEPHDEYFSEDDYVRLATVKLPIGNWVHTLIDRSHQRSSLFLPGYREKYYQKRMDAASNLQDTALDYFDHAAFAIEKDSLATVVGLYRSCFNFERFLSMDDDADAGITISSEDTKSSGLTTMTVAPPNNATAFKFVLVEPVNRGNTKSQIQEFLDFHDGPGVAHIALNTSDIIHTVSTAVLRGVDFIDVPSTYYDTWREQENRSEMYKSVEESWEKIQHNAILVDGIVENGYLLQTFTLPLGDRPTFYLEIICRKGNNGFGKRNIKSLFDAIERLQKERGNYNS
ncbi:4-hydroxyphenylpyruvate dioxygenase [Acrasis kona]|uniref:4-hydroxyphenylpyruvate dioxygenase n=1 Tax=Acrasis kona TaxID=1008807 RepID=A0AAW2YWQ5_9EUKA